MEARSTAFFSRSRRPAEPSAEFKKGEKKSWGEAVSMLTDR